MASGLEDLGLGLGNLARSFYDYTLHDTKLPTVNTNASCNEHSCKLTCSSIKSKALVSDI